MSSNRIRAKNPKDFFAQLGDRAKLAFVGCGYCLRQPKYLTIFIISWVLFAYIFTFFRDGNYNWAIISSGLGAEKKIEVLGKCFLAIFSNFTSFSGLGIIFLSFFQAVAIALMVFTYKNRNKTATLNGASTSVVATALGFLALGCPTCGISMLTPILTTIAGTGAGALSGTLGGIFIVVAFILIIFTLIRLGYLVFIIVSAENYKEKHERKNS